MTRPDDRERAAPGRLPDPRIEPVMLDANALQGTGAQAVAALRLMALTREGELDCALTPSTYAEVCSPETPAPLRRDVEGLRVTAARPAAVEEAYLLARVQACLQGAAQAGRHAHDAVNLVEAYGQGPYFVTNDKRILKMRDTLGAIMPSLWIVSPAELLRAYDSWAARDEDWRTDE